MSTVVLPTRVGVVARELMHRVRDVLAGQFVGMYLSGSLGLGDFDEASSDIDFLVVTRCDLSAGQLAELAAMHAGLAAHTEPGNPFWQRLEGSYIPVADIRRYDPGHSDHPTIGADWAFGVNHHGWTWVFERAIVRDSGLALAGPPPEELVDPIAPDELRGAVRHILQDFWAPIAAAPRVPEWLATAAYQAFAILSMCRGMHTLSTGGLASKPAAAAWVLATMDDGSADGHRWAAATAWALSHRADHAVHDPAAMLAVIRLALAEVGLG